MSKGEIMNSRRLIIGILIVVLIVGGYLFLHKGSNPDTNGEKLEIYFLDVGQGDSTFIRLPNAETMLIDGGKKSSGKTIVSNLKKLEVEEIDYLVATHPHEDHIGGLPEIIRNIDIKNVYLPNKTNNTKIFEELLLEIRNNDIRTKEAKLGLELLNESGLKINFLGPDKEYKDMNNNSALITVEYGKFKSIFMGDAEKAAEKALLDRGININSQVLKVGHHGSDTSTTEDFIKVVRPKYSFISVGKNNKYGHPNDIILDRLKNVGSKIFRTDEDGTIKLSTDGETIRIEKNVGL